MSEMREAVEKQLAEKEVVKARDRIMAIKSASEDVNRNLNDISTSTSTNYQLFMKNFNDFTQQSKEAAQAMDKITTMKSTAEDVSRNLNDLLALISTNRQLFMERLNQLRQQDKVLLADDLTNLFVFQTVTNLADGQKIVLDYDPIPQTIRIYFSNNRRRLDLLGYLEGNTIVFTNKGMWQDATNQFRYQRLNVEYVRKSPR